MRGSFGSPQFVVRGSFGSPQKIVLFSGRGRRVFNTGSGSRAPFSSPPFDYNITGTWGPARVFGNFQKWIIRNFHPLYPLLMEKPRPF